MATAPTTRVSSRSESSARTAPISRVPYLPGLDGMRGLAVVAVMIYHANSDWLSGGFLGVEVFFVISGYLITLLIIAERERTGVLDLRHFWLRRARRLLPALFVMLFGVVTYTMLFRSDALGLLRGDVIAGLTYVINWYQIWIGEGYTAAGDFAPLRHLWSLAVEEQFYLLWPLVMLVVVARGAKGIMRAAPWLFGISFAITVVIAVIYRSGPIGTCAQTPEQYWRIGERCISKIDTLYLSSITRAGGILMGAGFAIIWRPIAIMRSPMRTKGPLADLAALIGLVGLAAMTWWISLIGPDGADPWLFRGGFFVCGLLTLMLIAGVTHQRARTGALLGNPVLLWIGTRSYGLYLFHWPIYQAIRKVAGNPLTFWQFIVAMVLTAVVTEGSYRLVETPIRTGHIKIWWADLRRARDPMPRRVVLGVAASLAVIGLFSSVSLATAPLKQNEIAESLDEAAGAVTDLGQLLDGGSTVTTNPGGTNPSSSIVDPDPDPDPDPNADAATTTTTTTTTTTAPPPPPIPLLAVGDSVMLGAAPALRERGLVVDAQESRQMREMVPTMQQLQLAGRFGTAVVVHLGTNGPIGTDTLDAFMATLAEVPNVVVMTVRANRGWTAGNNEKLRALTARPNVILLDWETLGGECPGQCFYSDGIHLRPEGQQYYSRLIFDVLGV